MLKQGLIFILVFTMTFTLIEVFFFGDTFNVKLLSKAALTGVLGYLIALLIQPKK